MGTNYYRCDRAADDYDEPRRHVGKQAAAGAYCWHCGLTLCKRGEEYIHSGPSQGVPYLPLGTQGNWSGRYIDWTEYHRRQKADWYNACPRCGGTPQKETITDSAAGVMLEFAAQSDAERRRGVRSVCSFSWAQDPEGLPDGVKIEDEYGRRYTFEEFQREVLANCPVQYTHSIGARFS